MKHMITQIENHCLKEETKQSFVGQWSMETVIKPCGPGGKGYVFVVQAVKAPSPCHMPAWLCVHACAFPLPC